MLADKPKLIANNTYLDDIYNQIDVDNQKGANRSTINSIHFSDFHVDLEYTEGAPAECDALFCCRNYPDETPSKDVRKAGRWGDFNCDMPFDALESML